MQWRPGRVFQRPAATGIEPRQKTWDEHPDRNHHLERKTLVSKATSLRARATAVLSYSAIATMVLVGLAGPAQAESPILGTLALNPSSGGVDDDPFVASATTPAPCPTEYGDNASLRVGPAGGPYRLLARIGSSGGYDQAPVTFASNRSLAVALGAAPADGRYEVVINCGNAVSGTTYAKNFSSFITVTGNTWTVADAASTTTKLTVKPGLVAIKGKPVTLTAKVRPAGSAGTVEFFAGSTSLGSVAAANGTAVLTTRDLPAGLLRLTSAFTPDDARLHKPSTSDICYLVIG